MTARGYKYPDSAWAPLEYPWVGRALRTDAQMEVDVERPRGGEPRSPTHRPKAMTGYGLAAANIEADDRMSGGPDVALPATRNSRCLRDSEPTAIVRAYAEVESMLRDPATHAYGGRKLVSLMIYRSAGSAPLRLQVVCACGRKQFVNAKEWVHKSAKLGLVCVDCSRIPRHNRTRISARPAPFSGVVEVLPSGEVFVEPTYIAMATRVERMEPVPNEVVIGIDFGVGESVTAVVAIPYAVPVRLERAALEPDNANAPALPADTEATG